MHSFTVATEGQKRLGLREVCKRYVDEQWLASHMTPEQAAESVLDQFKRAGAAELELLTVECRDGNAVDGKSTA